MTFAECLCETPYEFDIWQDWKKWVLFDAESDVEVHIELESINSTCTNYRATYFDADNYVCSKEFHVNDDENEYAFVSNLAMNFIQQLNNLEV